jgi:hypothetical protein
VSEMNGASGKTPTDVTGLIEVICGLRAERYPFERYVALLTFNTWLRWPAQPDAVEQAEIVAAARLILGLDYGEIKVAKEQRQRTIEEIASKIFTPLAAAEALANPSIHEPFWLSSQISMGSLIDVAVIAAFILKCPLEMAPSVNKALFFISRGGFADAYTIEHRGRTQPYKVPQSDLKYSWSSLAIASPFSLAAERLSLSYILDLSPDGEKSIPAAARFLRSLPRVRRYFGHAKFIQEALLKRLDKQSQKHFQVRFPDSIEPFITKVNPFKPDQVKLIASYNAKSRFKKAGLT